ncbi:MAG: helix-turn-helix domain-containing protein, partial [Candidatus Polarisedimenticolia bacterium]
MASFGETLRQQRELREISLRQVSEATKINIRYLEALEQNHFDILPGGLFNKGFIRAYAKYVGLDGEAMVTSYLHEIATRNPGAASDTGAPAPLHRPVDLPQRRAGPRHPPQD